jgi:hypothetical protein
MGMTLAEAKKLEGAMSLAEAKRLTGPELEAPGVLAKVGRGMMDIAQGTKQLYLSGQDSLTGSNDAAIYTKAVDAENRLYEQGRGEDAGIDWWRIGGNAAATLPIALIPGTASMSVLTRTGAGAAQGAAASALNYTPEGTSKAEQVALGAVAGGALPNVLAGVSRVVNPQVRPEVKTLMDAGVTPTPGQIMGGRLAVAEEKLGSLPLLGDKIRKAQQRGIDELNKATYQKALDPIGETSSGIVGREGVAEVSDKLSKAYSELLPKLQFKADTQFGEELSNIQKMVTNLPEADLKQFERIIKNQLINKMTPQGNMAGETFKSVESELGRIASGYKGDPSFDKRQLGDALQSVLDSMKANLGRSNPDFADELNKINSGWATYARIRAAGAADKGGEGFTPGQLQSAVRSADKSVGKGNFAKGEALLQDLSDAGVRVLASKYPDSGTAGRTLLSWLALGGAGQYVNPMIPVTAVSGMLPYTRQGQKIAAGLLTQRPSVAQPLSSATRKAGKLVNLPLMGLLADHTIPVHEP